MGEPWYQRALEAQRRGDLGAALAACDLAPPDRASQALAQTVRAATLARLARWDEALSAVHAAERLGGRSVELLRIGAKSLLGSGEVDAAFEWINRALESNPRSRRTLELREKIISRTPLLTGLFEHMELAVQLYPDDLHARDKLVRSYLELGIFSPAIEHVEASVRRDPLRAQRHIDSARAYVGSGRSELGVEALERALQLEPVSIERTRIVQLLIRAGQLDRALSVAEESERLAPSDPNVQLQSGFLALWRGRVADAAAICQSLPSIAGSMKLRAAIAFVENDFTASLEWATRAGDLGNGDGEAHSIRAAALLFQGRYGDANEAALQAMAATKEWLPAAELVALGASSKLTTVRRFDACELFRLLAPLWKLPVEPPNETGNLPSEFVVNTVRGGLARLSGNFSSVLTYVAEDASDWSTFVALPPSRSACFRVFDRIHALPWDRVAHDMCALKESYPDSPYVHMYAGEVWLWSGDYEKCEAECRKAIEISTPDGSLWPWIGLAGSLMLRARYSEALEVFAELWRLTPPRSGPSPPMLVYRGETLRRCNDLEAAGEDLRLTVRRTPSRVGAWINLALVAIAQQRYVEARDIHSRLRAQVPQLLQDLEKDLSIAETDDPLDPESLHRIFEYALQAMRGNRGSGRVTYFLRDGLARVTTATRSPG